MDELIKINLDGVVRIYISKYETNFVYNTWFTTSSKPIVKKIRKLIETKLNGKELKYVNACSDDLFNENVKKILQFHRNGFTMYLAISKDSITFANSAKIGEFKYVEL